MKNWMQLVLAALVAALVGFGSSFYATPERSARGAASEADDLLAAVEELRAEQERLGARLEALPVIQSAPATANRTPTLDLEQAIAAYMAGRLASEEEAVGAVEGQAADNLEAAAIADRILFQDLTYDQLQELWQQLRDSGQIDVVLAAIEAEAELAPSNPDLQAELGKAYIQKLFDVGMGPMAMAWSEKADGAFERALELDETHWDARFNKAVSLSHAPAFLGKQRESMRHFEILVEQQERSAPESGHAMSYYFLGNLYEQNGELDRARKTWGRGAELFPDYEGLRQKLEAK